MIKAIQASKSVSDQDVPVGAVVVRISDGAIIATGHNTVYQNSDPTGHAEINAIREACRIIGSSRLNGMAIYTTLEPCFMCSHAIALAKLENLYIGAPDRQGGAISCSDFFNNKSCNHRPSIYFGIMEEECSKELNRFFANLRAQQI